MLKAIVDSDEAALKAELDHSREMVESNMRRIVGIFLDADSE